VSRVSLIVSFAAIVVTFGIVAPSADAARQRTDPEASSPAGVIYEIPFDSARRDAAPQSARTGEGQDGTTGTDGSSSDDSGNGSDAAGAAAAGAGGPGGSDGSDGSGGPDGSGAAAATDPNVGTSIHSENGFGSSSAVPGVAGETNGSDGPPTSALRTASTATDASPVGTYGMLAVVILVGGWIGVAAARGLRIR
jgi:hypothetical protein